MTAANLTIHLDAIIANWRVLDALSGADVETAAVIKADAYGLGVSEVAKPMFDAGVRTFFVATAEEGVKLYAAIGAQAKIYVFSGQMASDNRIYYDFPLVPLLNSLDQVKRYLAADNSAGSFGLQLDTGMNRLGMEADELEAALALLGDAKPELAMSHLACADEPDHPMNAAQLAEFRRMTEGRGWRRSLSATGGVLLGSAYHFDLCRPGIGLYGGAPFSDAEPAVTLSLPVIQTRMVAPGETVGYGGQWTAKRPARIATLAAGYADGLIRAMGNTPPALFAGGIACPLVGRVSMDLLTVDVSELDTVPDSLELLNLHQTVDDLADAAGTIGYEILTSLGARYNRRYSGA
jgi:alanine racemase